MARDLKNSVKVQRVISPVAVGTTGTGQTGKVIDRAGYEGVTFIVSYGAITATAATFVVTVKEGDATGSLTSVADVDLIGTEAAAGLAAGARTSGSTKLVAKSIGYRGMKQYVSASVYSTATAGTPVSVTAVLSSPAHAPAA
jgi:hypothetical protein